MQGTSQKKEREILDRYKLKSPRT